MDSSHILVLVLTLSTVGLLVWIELKSRRNQRASAEPPSDEAARKEQLPKQQ